uniref:Uncharacterized protein n=1 Tax=Syphacia muris TaxID=451379 RepID=A0A0N5ASA0_9BILA
MIVLSIVAMASSEGELLEAIKDLRPLDLKTSAMGCPLIVVGELCPTENIFYYYTCCGTLNSTCCFRVQDWVLVLILFLGACIIFGIVLSLVRCMCCGR